MEEMHMFTINAQCLTAVLYLQRNDLLVKRQNEVFIRRI